MAASQSRPKICRRCSGSRFHPQSEAKAGARAPANWQRMSDGVLSFAGRKYLPGVTALHTVAISLKQPNVMLRLFLYGSDCAMWKTYNLEYVVSEEGHPRCLALASQIRHKACSESKSGRAREVFSSAVVRVPLRFGGDSWSCERDSRDTNTSCAGFVRDLHSSRPCAGVRPQPHRGSSRWWKPDQGSMALLVRSSCRQLVSARQASCLEVGVRIVGCIGRFAEQRLVYYRG